MERAEDKEKITPLPPLTHRLNPTSLSCLVLRRPPTLQLTVIILLVFCNCHRAFAFVKIERSCTVRRCSKCNLICSKTGERDRPAFLSTKRRGAQRSSTQMHAMIISQQQDDGIHRSVLRRGGHTAVTTGAMLFPGEPGAMVRGYSGANQWLQNEGGCTQVIRLQ